MGERVTPGLAPAMDAGDAAELERYRGAADRLCDIPVETMAELPYILAPAQMQALVDLRIMAAKGDMRRRLSKHAAPGSPARR